VAEEEGEEFELAGKYRLKVLKLNGKKIEKVEVVRVEE